MDVACTALSPVSMSIHKIISSEACLPDCTAKSADGKLFVNRDYTTVVLLAKNNVTATLSDYGKAEFLENLDCFRT